VNDPTSAARADRIRGAIWGPHYGDGALVLLDTMSRNSAFDPRSFGAAFVGTFADEHYQGYIDKATRGTIANLRAFTNEHPQWDFDFQRGANDDQPATLTRLSVLVGQYAEVPLSELVPLVDALTLVTQDKATARAGARFSALKILADSRSA
jgi:ADP-ribosylglycohydrolase